MERIKGCLVFCVFHLSQLLISPFLSVFVFLSLIRSNIRHIRLAHLKSLRKHGFVAIPNFYTKEYCESIIYSFDKYESENLTSLTHNSDLRLFHAEVVFNQLNIFYNDQLLNKIASSYIGFPIRNSGCLVNRVPPMSGDFGSGGSWHRDANFPQFKALVYLSEVHDTNDGAFQYIPRSNRILSILKDSFLLDRRISMTRWSENEVQQRYSTGSIKSVLGSPGTLILFDTSLLHRGAANLNTSKSRYAMTNYYYPKFGSIGQYF